MVRPLEQLRVVEVSQLIAAPFCALTLADYGAEVIKVETAAGDYSRQMPPIFANGESGYFQMLNRNKTLVRHELPSDAVRDLVLSADVIVENAGEKRLGITYDEVHAHNPKAIWCAISGSGRGKRSRMIDPGIQASMGMMALTGDADRPPARLPVPAVDFTCGLYAAQSILATLLAGEGALLDCALIDAAATLTSTVGVYAMHGDQPLRRMGSQSMWYAPAGNFKAADGQYVQLIALNASHWRAIAETIGHAEWLEDPRYADNEARMANAQQLHDAIARAIASQPAAHWETAVIAAGGFCQRIREIEEAWADPLLAERGLVTELDGVSLPTATLTQAAAQRVPSSTSTTS